MATDAVDRREAHIRGLTVTTLASVAGIIAALLSAAMVMGPGTPVTEAATDELSVYILAGVTIAQFPVLRILGIDVDDFGGKDFVYVVFMTFSLWFVCWTIFLTTGTAL